MKYLIAIVLAVSLSLGVAILPSFADSGVSVTLTTTVTGGSNGDGGGGGSFDSGDSIPYTPPNWASIFPSMNQPQSSAPSDSRTVQQNPPIYIPPVVSQSNTYVPPVTPVAEERDSSKDNLMYVFIGLGALLIGLVIYLILPEQRVR
jgi:hypothetical protein